MNNVFDSPHVDLYHLLGLKPGEKNQTIIKKNFSDLIKIFHSDRGGDSRFHQQIVEAYRILSDHSRKFIYDSFGLFGVYSISEDDELLKMYSDVISSPHCTQEETDLIKIYVTKKIHKKLIENYKNSQESEFSSTDISSNFSTGIFDYLYLTSFTENKNLFLNKKINFNKISLDNNLTLFKTSDNNKEVNLNINYQTNQRNYGSHTSYALEFTNRFILPFGIKLFDQDFMDSKIGIERLITSTHSDIILRKSLTVFSLFKLPLNFTFTPIFSLFEKRLAGLELNCDYYHTKSISSSTKVDPINKTFDLTINYKLNKQKFVSLLNLGENRFSLGAFYFENISSRLFQSKSLFLRNNGLFATNESIIHWSSLALKLTSSVQLAKSKSSNGIKFNSSFNLAIQIGSFKIQFPIAIASESNLMSHSFIILSGLLGSFILFIRKRLKSSNEEYVRILDKVNREKLKEYNINNKAKFDKKVISEKNKNGLVIKIAYLGEYNTILYIYKSLLLFGEYRNEDPNIFDVKVPLMMHIVNSKLNIPNKFTDIEGVFIPNYNKKDKLALVIKYTYNYDDFTVIVENGHFGMSLPLLN